MQSFVGILPHLAHVATVVKHERPKKSTKFTVFQKTMPIHLSVNCHFITRYIISNSLNQRTTTFCCEIS